MSSGFFVIRLGKTFNEVFKNISAVNGTYFIGSEIAFFGIKLLDNKVKCVALNHTANYAFKIELRKNVLNIGGKSCKIITKVIFYIIGVGTKQLKCKFACIIKNW